MQRTASYFPVSARVRAAEGISKAPGTRTIAISSSRAPERSSPSNALCSSRSVMKALNRETTMPKRFPPAFSPPSSAFPWNLERAGSAALFSSVVFSSVMRGPLAWATIQFIPEPSGLRSPAYFPLNCAARFSRNAVVPSFLSSVAQHIPNRLASRYNPSASVISMPWFTASSAY